MADYIDRQKAIVELRKEMYADTDYMSDLICVGIADVLNKLPSADVQPVRHEHWGSKNECSGCGCQPWYERDIRFLHYCPNCGARMDGAT